MKKNNMKSILMLASLALIVTSVIGTTIAYLVSNEVSVTNTFTAAQVSNEVKEVFDDNTTKSNVKIKNTGDIPAYIRVALICTWKDAEGNFVSEPASLEDLDIDWGDFNKDEDQDGGYWVQFAEYYYYSIAIPANGTTDNLIDSARVKTANGYQFNLEIISSAIQADGMGANSAKEAWETAKGTQSN